jgi:hypothetical protein
MILQPDDFDAFFGRPISREGFTIDDALRGSQNDGVTEHVDNRPDRLVDPQGGRQAIAQRNTEPSFTRGRPAG